MKIRILQNTIFIKHIKEVVFVCKMSLYRWSSHTGGLIIKVVGGLIIKIVL